MPDAGPVMVDLLIRPECYGEAWNFAGPGEINTMDFITRIYRAVGRAPKYRTGGRGLLKLLGYFNADIREVVEMLYLQETPGDPGRQQARRQTRAAAQDQLRRRHSENAGVDEAAAVTSSRERRYILSNHEEISAFALTRSCRVCADAAARRTDRAPARVRPRRPEGSHHQDAVRARRQRRLGPGLSLRRRFPRAGHHLAGQSTRRSHGADRRLHAVDAAHQNAHRRHAFVSVLRRRQTARRARRRHRLQSRFVCQARRAARQGQREADHRQQDLRRHEIRLLGLRFARSRSRRFPRP